MKIDHLSYKVEWIKGADNKEADALSRAPSSQATAEDKIDEPHDELLAVVNNLVAGQIPEVNAVFREKYDQFMDENFDIFYPTVIIADIENKDFGEDILVVVVYATPNPTLFRFHFESKIFNLL